MLGEPFLVEYNKCSMGVTQTKGTKVTEIRPAFSDMKHTDYAVY
jgi:hypothetical protein